MTNHTQVEMLFFQAFNLMNKFAGSDIRQKYDRLEHAYAKYILSVNSSDPDIKQKRDRINRHLHNFIESLRSYTDNNFDETRNDQQAHKHRIG